MRRQDLDDLELGHGVLRGVGIERAARRVALVSADRCLDAPTAGARPAADEGEVLPLEGAAPHEPLEAVICLLCPGDDQEARGVAVEAVDDARTFQLASRETAVQRALYERSGGVTRARVDDEPGGLVHDEEVLVLVGDAELERPVLDVRGRIRSCLDVDRLARGEAVAFRAGDAVDRDRSGRDQPLGNRARGDVGELGDEAVEPLAGLVLRDAQRRFARLTGGDRGRRR